MLKRNELKLAAGDFAGIIVLRSVVRIILFIVPGLFFQVSPLVAQISEVKKLDEGGLKGYISMRIHPPPDGFGYGVSFYSGVWPLLEKPLSGFQIGLPSTWIVPDNKEYNEPLCPIGTIARDNWPKRAPSYRDVFQTIEGGLGFWVSTQFKSVTPKFRINATPNCYNTEISSPGWGFGRTKALNATEMGLAQLSNRIIIPPDGLTLKTGPPGQLFGNAWMALPLMPSKPKQSPDDVPTGDQSWTLFINSANFKGPVAFYIPQVWSRIAKGYPTAEGRGLDTRPGIAGGGAMEVNTVPYFETSDAKGAPFSKIPKLQFPINHEGQTVLMQDVKMYSVDALYRPLELSFNGKEQVSGKFQMQGSYNAKCSTSPITLKQGPDNVKLTGFSSLVETKMLGESSFGLDWKNAKGLGYFPEYFKKEGDSMVAIASKDIPAETHLNEQSFEAGRTGQSYTSWFENNFDRKSMGSKAGPYTVNLNDGSKITYYWYRFVDQPSLLSLNMTDAEKERMQKIVEFIHRNWTTAKQYMSPPSKGELVSMDQAILVNPPKGLEVGYVPIVTSQVPVGK